ncbi:MAG: hypothetical protein M1816_003270 [Peltula sp. TS41687]|nr:MAG: hypothetical protein M1816_003270 [Peltula sp. TS41687]
MDFELPEIEPIIATELEEFFREEALTRGSSSSEGEAPVTNYTQTHATVTTERMNIVTPRSTMLRGGIVRTRTQPLAMRGRSRNHGVGDWSREVVVGDRRREVRVAGSGSESRGRGYDSPGQGGIRLPIYYSSGPKASLPVHCLFAKALRILPILNRLLQVKC